MAKKPSGRLELTWTNKEWVLLADEDGLYDWVPASDYRVAEVRLLREAARVGDAADGILIRGDALAGLHSLHRLPSFSQQCVGQVRLAYIDPPFNTRRSFLQYDDSLSHSVWLTMLRDRLVQIRELLAPSGSVWLHLDDSEAHRARVVMDEVFGEDCFVATVVWESRYSRSNDAGISTSHNYLIVYSPSPHDWSLERNRLPRTVHQARQYTNPDGDPRGPWRAVPWDAPGIRENLSYPISTPSGAIRLPPPGRHWSRTEEKWDEIVAARLAYFGKAGDGAPAFKQYLSEASEIVPNTWWEHEETGHSDEAAKEIKALFPDEPAFSTPKPERLLERILRIATDPGDLVLDCFLGSGTTAAVAQKMGRRWIGIERNPATLDAYAIPRLTRVVEGLDPGGVTSATGWEGGGGFRILDVAPSMFENDQGVVFLAEWATNGELAEATAAQLGFPFEASAPFCGRKGRSRLAVIDGMVSPTVIELLVGALGEGETVVVCGTSIDPDAGVALSGLRPGSQVRKIPAALLNEYHVATRWRPKLPATAPAGPPGGPPLPPVGDSFA